MKNLENKYLEMLKALKKDYEEMLFTKGVKQLVKSKEYSMPYLDNINPNEYAEKLEKILGVKVDWYNVNNYDSKVFGAKTLYRIHKDVEFEFTKEELKMMEAHAKTFG